MKTLQAGAVIASALAVSGCEFRTAADVEAELEAHYGKIGAVDPDIVGVNAMAAEAEQFQFLTIGPGQWRATNTVSGEGRREVTQRCHAYPRRIDQALDLTPVWSMTKDCKIKTGWSYGAYTIEYACNDGNSRMNATARVTGDFEKRYLVETKINYATPGQRAQTLTTTTTAERIGDC